MTTILSPPLCHSRSLQKYGYINTNQWGGLCVSGKKQSPIDLQPADVEITNMPEINFVNYDRTGPVEFADNDITCKFIFHPRSKK